MATHTTLTSAPSWRPDVVVYPSEEVIPSALALVAGNVVANIEGDAPTVRIPRVTSTAEPGFVPEGTLIPDSGAALDEVTVGTRKIAVLGRFSREQAGQANTLRLALASLTASVVRSADEAFLNHADETDTTLTGILAGKDLPAPLAYDGLGSLIDAAASVEDDGGRASVILANPRSWATVAKDLDLGHESVERRVLGLPVVTNSAVPAGTLAVVDRDAVPVATGQVEVARSEEALFTHDSVLVRVLFRLGWTVADPARVQRVTVA
ncbi:phage major capsid protein [Georgenia wutianyii]|uniref:Phage major capsid protein n=1 Tax=Georgenia wutianyii TaxID=2585135 RepID=A0ABX5VM16_9MICO|nr:phage major capsid protein [Georgenia wutianyii]QDB79537.1 phage major capsid protein [Georgenia wutianyii]